MRYRQSHHHCTGRDQQAEELINSQEALSTKEQEEVLAYFSRSLQGSRHFFQVIVCLHVVVASLYMSLLLCGSSLIDVSIDMTGTSGLVQSAQAQQGSTEPATVELTLATLNAENGSTQRTHAPNNIHHRSSAAARVPSGRVITTLSVVAMLYNVALLLWAAWSCYEACCQLRVDVEDLKRAGMGDLNRRHPQESFSSVTPATKQRLTLRNLCKWVKADPVLALYVAAALASLSSLFWATALMHRQRATQSAYADLGLQPLPVMSLQNIPGVALECVLVVWQPLFHLGVGILARSLLNTREELVALSKLKYRYDKA
ncbi:hypothetical protein JKF63_06289 [Porcisia hertigi]|uniref:Uncharacterized protein n=1 Tax=Porcisia hertigi TaxID=2761500 RepID=A0A836LF06_9TRYP|nr:hypothetical protein JKF63_06289 [Porcisia hertigi]